MQCPRCGNFESRVLKTYEKIEQDTRVRVRICLHCGYQMRTIEHIDKATMKKLNRNHERK